MAVLALSRGFGRHAFAGHLALIAPPWSAAVAMIVRLPRHPRGTLPNRLRPLGRALAAVAAAVWIDAFRRRDPALNLLEARIERLALEGGGAVPADGGGNRRRLRPIAEGEDECRGEGD